MIVFFRGKLNLAKQIKYNLIDQSRFYCTHKILSMNTPINRAIRYAYSILEKNGCGQILAELKTYDQRLESFGVEKKVKGVRVPAKVKRFFLIFIFGIDVRCHL